MILHRLRILASVIFIGWGLTACNNDRQTRHNASNDSLQAVSDSISRLLSPAEAKRKAYQLDTFFTNLHRKQGFNGTVIVSQYGKPVYRGAFGYGDFKRKDTLTLNTAFQLASVSKQFTAAAIMLLQERGKLSYDDVVQKFFPKLPYDSITIRQLLTHRGGLSNYTYFSDEHWPDRKKTITNRDVINLMVQHQPAPYFRPDVRYDYSNTGYCLLAAIVAKVSGNSFEQFMQREIFKPLGMKHTWIANGKTIVLTARQATGYTGGRRIVEDSYLDGVTGDKGVYSTVEDLFTWDQALYSERLIRQATLEEAFQPGNPEMKKENYGFGWRLQNLENGEPVLFHGGWWHGFKSYFLRNRRDRSAIIVLSNVANASMSHLRRMQEILYSENQTYPPKDAVAKKPADRPNQAQ